jgi:hypothetical protein
MSSDSSPMHDVKNNSEKNNTQPEIRHSNPILIAFHDFYILLLAFHLLPFALLGADISLTLFNHINYYHLGIHA